MLKIGYIQKFDLHLSGSLIDRLSVVGRLVQIICTPKLLRVYYLDFCLAMVAFEYSKDTLVVTRKPRLHWAPSLRSAPLHIPSQQAKEERDPFQDWEHTF